MSQLQYEHESGRESVLEMLAYIFQTFPQVRKSVHTGVTARFLRTVKQVFT